MALDGIVIKCLTKELTDTLTNARIYKIAQPEADELLITFKTENGQIRLLASANAGLPLVYLTDDNKVSPLTAPSFCMLLRKHIQNGRILSVTQPALERIIDFAIEHRNELGDLCEKHLIIELMGKHSNIIFCDDKEMILDSIKHVSAQMSSVREVLPGRHYFIPETTHQTNPLSITEEVFQELIFQKSMPLCQALNQSFLGLGPVMAQTLCSNAAIDSSVIANSLSENEQLHLFHTFQYMMEDIRSEVFAPNIVYSEKEPVEYAVLPLTQYSNLTAKPFDSISCLLESYYSEKEAFTRIRQKSSDLRRIVQTALDRCKRKYVLQQKQLADTEKRDKYKVYGELLHTYGYNVREGATSLEALNYYTNETIQIPLDSKLTPAENAQHYFARYNKLKRTFEALSELIKETQSTIEHLDSVSTALDIAESEDDLLQIKEELVEFGYIRKKTGLRKNKSKSRPFHYISTDGYDIYIGRNNYQNDELTFKFATGNDWWFHTKGIPGSHVILKSTGDELPIRAFEEAGRLAAFYSKARGNDKVEIDYTQKKNVKKPGGAKPGFVVYYTNYSLVIDSDITNLKAVEE